jgi:hypothetical protein
MSLGYRWYFGLFAAVILAPISGSSWAQAAGPAGRFLSVVGDVKVVGANGAQRPAERSGELREGETIITGANGLAQVRMADSGLISVRADTEMKLDKFAYAGQDDKNASFLASIIKGGFRTITGLIGHANRDGYRISTPTATVGIRGTHFEIVHLPQAPAPNVQPGTYNRVFDGITTFQNRGGASLLVNRDQTAFIGLQGRPPVLVPPPPAIFGNPTAIPGVVLRGGPQGPGASGQQGQGGTQGAADKAAPATQGTTTTTVTPLRAAPATLTAPTTTLTPVQTTPLTVSPAVTPVTTTPLTTVPTTPLTVSPAVTPTPTTTITPIQTTPIMVSPVVTPIQTAPVTTTPTVTTPATTAPITTVKPIAPVITK